MKLTDPWFQAHLWSVTLTGARRNETELSAADGVSFWCPCAYGTKHYEDDTHWCSIPFSNGTHPNPAGWEMSGSGLADLTLRPSIKNSGYTECWHGYLTSGDLNSC